MKKIIKINWALLAVMLLFASSSCESNEEDDINPADTDNSGYFLKAKVDGKIVEFKTETLLSVEIEPGSNGTYSLALSGGRQSSGQNSLEESIAVILTETSPIKEKTYTGLVPFEFGLKGVLLGYALDVEYIAYTTDVKNPNVNLEITEIKPNFVKGKFKEVVIDFLSGKTKTITEGEFFAPRRN
ncbi:hypothetical protein [Lunatibacter salilacus]|uniref:hypothetical protein n=1 Tax=Lunatibacter salilacus TaxID=2483804 RepID=UPI00131EBDDF|nr:hypothetical protein [Lunatibacter salilacus]